MAARKQGNGGDVGALIRDAGARAKLAVEHRLSEIEASSNELVTDEIRPFQPKIFNILEYVESSWGLNLPLFPAQRFLVKLYYHLPLEDKVKTIKISDMLGEKNLYHFTEKEYLQYLHKEGRCNIGEQDHERRELVLAIGRRAGKCLTGDTLVFTDKGVMPIEEIGEAPEEGYTPLELEVAQESGKRAKSAYFYNGGVKPTFHIKSKSAYSICGTGNHRVRVLGESGAVEWRYLDEIKQGDYLAINRKADLWASEYVDTRPYHNTDGRKEIQFPDVLDEKWGRLLGYLVGDGSWTNTQAVAVTVEHTETWDALGSLFDELFGSHRVQMDTRTDNTGRLEFVGVGARRFLDALGWSSSCGRYTKRVPWAILRSPRSVVCAFLRGLFETDGSAESGGRHITFSTASFDLAHEIQILLLNLGIVSNVSRKWNAKTKRHYANLSLKGVRSRRLFAQHIGFDSEKKSRPMWEALETAQDGKSDTESIPNQHRRLRDLLESIPKRNPVRGELGWGRTKVREICGNACKPGSNENLSYTRLERTLEAAREQGAGVAEISHFERLQEQDYFFDPVVSVEEGEGQVYDLNVPEGSAFVANGFTNHNTTLSSIFASYEVYRLLNLGNPQQYYGLPNGNRIQIISVATDKDQAGILFNEVTGHLAKCEYFKPYIANNTLSHIQFRTPYDIDKYGPSARHQNGKFVSFNGKTSLRVTFKSSIAKGLRGAGNAVVILDEMAHFQANGQASAKDIYDAVTPSTAAFSPKLPDEFGVFMPIEKPDGTKYPVEARIISISSPLNRHGKFYELFNLAMTGGPGSENILAIQAPTWEINPTVPSSYYKQKYHSDPAVFMTEHGAQFSDRVRGWIEREQDLVDCIDPNHRPLMVGMPRHPHQMGIDIGLVNDGTAIAITTNINGKIVLVYHEHWKAGVDWRETNPHLGDHFSTDYCKILKDTTRLDFDEIANWIWALTKKFHITDGIFDSWNGIPLEQSLLKKGLSQFKSEHFKNEVASRIYQNAKMLMFDRSLVLYDTPIPSGSKHSMLIQEILQLQAEQVSKYLVKVQAPQAAGYHDDCSDALVRAVWLTSERNRNEVHVYGSSARPMAARPAMTPERYQRARALKHGFSAARVAPRNFRR